MRMGARGAAVKALQTKLANLGYALEIDGVFGRGTREVVETFQASQGLEVDGVVGPKTQAALDQATPTATPTLPAAGEALLAKVLERNPRLGQAQRDVLAEGTRWLGAREVYGTNRGPEIDPMVKGFMEHHGGHTDSQGPPWCAIFASSVIRRGLGLAAWEDTPMGDWLGSAWAFEQWAIEAGVWVSKPYPGAVGVIAWTHRPDGTYSGHVGLVLWVDAEAGTVTTLDGNVTDSVAVRTRPVTAFRGFACWWEAMRQPGVAPARAEPSRDTTTQPAEPVATAPAAAPQEEPMTPEMKAKLDELRAEREAKAAGLSEARGAVASARAAKREAEPGDARDAAKARLRAAVAARREARGEAREAKRDVVALERDLGLREGLLAELLATALAPVLDRIQALEDTLPEVLAKVAGHAAKEAVEHIDFTRVVPGAAGEVLEEVDDKIVDVLTDLFEATMDDDGLTHEDIAALATEHLLEQGLPVNLNQVWDRLKGLVG